MWGYDISSILIIVLLVVFMFLMHRGGGMGGCCGAGHSHKKNKGESGKNDEGEGSSCRKP